MRRCPKNRHEIAQLTSRSATGRRVVFCEAVIRQPSAVRTATLVFVRRPYEQVSLEHIAHQLGVTDHGVGSSQQARNVIQCDRVLDSLAVLIPVEAETVLAVTSWLGFTQTAVLGWIDDPNISRRQLLELCMRALLGAVNFPS